MTTPRKSGRDRQSMGEAFATSFVRAIAYALGGFLIRWLTRRRS